MTIRIPDGVAAPVFATSLNLDSRPDALILTFLLNERDETHTAVSRVALAPGSLESLYVELGALITDRRERGWSK
ncbi:MAG: hypothetical protein K0S49_58 [Microbacterium sp.]|jgi:hypothetical protein|nr:hypothetical protein [Microbacterium sp.]